MINKPINPSPFNTCVDMSKNWKISCEIPNDTIDQAYVSVNKLDTGEQIYGEYKTFDTPSNKIEVEMSDSFAEYNDGEYSWNTFYYQMPDENDKAIEYEVANADENKLVLSSNSASVLLKTNVDIYGFSEFNDTIATQEFGISSADYNNEYIKYEGYPVLVGVSRSEFSSFYSYIQDVGIENCFLRFVNSATDKIISSAKILLYSADSILMDDSFDRDVIYNTFYKKYMTNSGDHPFRESIFYDDRDSVHSESDLQIQLCQIGRNDTSIQVGGYILHNNYLYRVTNVKEDDRISITTNPSLNSYYAYKGLIEGYWTKYWGGLDNILTPGIYCYINTADEDEEEHYVIVAIEDDILNQYVIAKKTYWNFASRTWRLRSRDSTTSTWSGWTDFEIDATLEEWFTSNPHVGSKIKFYTADSLDINISPHYYFRAKTPPIVGIETYNQFIEETEMIDDTTEIKNYKLSDFKAQFGVKYSSGIKFNYGCFYLSAFNPDTYNWDLIEHSPMVLDSNNLKISDIYTYNGFVNGQKYKIYGVYTDIDGDEWTTDEFEFVVDIPIISTQTKMFDIKFNTDKTTVDISINKLLDMYEEMSIEFYKLKKNDVNSYMVLQYAGGGFCKSGDIIAFNKWYDYNIQNDAYYDYYARVEYLDIEDAGAKKIDIFHVASDIHTDFKGTSILSLERVNDTHLGIVDNFNIFYHFDENKTELTNEISREYMNTFSRYPKELKGYQNSISSRFTGLLGNEINGLYIEPKGIREKWINFVNDDTVKFYRGYDGQTMIISINSSTVKPRNYAGYGIVNEVDISFKEIASTNQYAVFGTERTGD